MAVTLKSGVVHTIPADLRAILFASNSLQQHWNSLTPLARNEWICWVITVKKPETRLHHLKRLKEEFAQGARRPCCWPGCPHRRETAKKWFR